MDYVRLGRVFRAIRLKLRLRQVDVAARARVSATVVSRIEHGRTEEVSLPALARVAEALEIRLDLVARWRGGDLDRVMSSAHSAFAESVVELLSSGGWDARPEVSFSRYGERGVIDLLGWHAGARTVLVIELKTEMVDVGETLGTLDRKRRLACQVARDLGWQPAAVAVALFVTDTRTNRRRVQAHQRTFRAAFPGDTRSLRRWLAAPAGDMAALAFLPNPRSASVRQPLATSRRVRAPKRAA